MKSTKTAPSQPPFTTQENSLHRKFAARAISKGGWEVTASAFLAMRRECTAHRLRPCDFRQFCTSIRSMRSCQILWCPRSNWYDLPPENGDTETEAASVASLVRELECASIGGW